MNNAGQEVSKPAVKALGNQKQARQADSKAAVNEVEGKSPRKQDAKKQALLKKRKAYDPRAAIKN